MQKRNSQPPVVNSYYKELFKSVKHKEEKFKPDENQNINNLKTALRHDPSVQFTSDLIYINEEPTKLRQEKKTSEFLPAITTKRNWNP